MRTSLNPLMYNTLPYSKLFEETGTYEVLLSPGTYYISMCGGGGAGGSKGGDSTSDGQPGGNGGCGGTATVVSRTIYIDNAQRAVISVGSGGLTKANGGNGGNGGTGKHPGGNGGGGGGGGMPTYIQFEPHPVITNYYGWKCPPVNSGTYVGPTKTFYVTFASDNPDNVNISDTPMEYVPEGFVSGDFVLTSGNTYTDGQQLFYLFGYENISITIQISNGTIEFLWTTGNTFFGTTVVPLDISNNFVGNVVLTTSLTPGSNDPVYNTDFESLGNITSVDSDSFVYNSQTYTPYSAADTSTVHVVTTETIVAEGGGGGGGGGGGNEGDRSAEGSGGGGGGGHYVLLNSSSVQSNPGKNGGTGGSNNSNGNNGVAGYGDTVVSGAGGRGFATSGGAGASGYGASGGGGGGCKSNDGDGWRRPGGAGGGGAGGSLSAGGGAGGTANGDSYNAPGGDASYHRTTPDTSYNYLGQPTNLGMGGRGQTANQPATNGYNGWFYISKIQNATPWDMGGIADTVTNTVDCGQITETTNMFLQMGTIA